MRPYTVRNLHKLDRLGETRHDGWWKRKFNTKYKVRRV
jgi:hypothetical protein